ncbi:MAG: peptidoglycan-binding protein, partial [Candidatus Pacebacteria bacterium]|nr:peptidoglycan-binding protein [Candidatus Paceibacterota bacterium]
MSLKKLGALAVFVVVGLPVFAGALTSDELRAQIAALLTQIAALQQQLESQGGGSTTPGTNSACPRLTQNLRYGSQGDEVMELQQFLYAEGLLDESAMVGFYGTNTQRAVQTWQRTHNVISSGTPETTGYGAVGPKTRAAIAAACAAGTTTPPSPGTCPSYPALTCPAGQVVQEQPLGTNGCRPQAQCVQDQSVTFRGTPTSGPSPLSVTFTLGNANATGNYTINFGDGSSAAFPAGSSATQYHTYTAQGTFTATLTEQLGCSGGVCSGTPLAAGSVTIAVQRPAIAALATVAIGNASGTAP